MIWSEPGPSKAGLNGGEVSKLMFYAQSTDITVISGRSVERSDGGGVVVTTEDHIRQDRGEVMERDSCGGLEAEMGVYVSPFPRGLLISGNCN